MKIAEKKYRLVRGNKHKISFIKKRLNIKPIIRSIEIKNYKGFDHLKIYCEEFNIIIGENNIGKSSIFEALLLWKQCYDCVTLSKQTGFYKDSNNKYLRYEDLEFLRLTSDRDLFNEYILGNKAISIIVELEYKSTTYELGFEITCSDKPGNVYFRINYVDSLEFRRFANDFEGKVSDAIYIHKTQPIALIPSKEPYMNKAQVRRKIVRGKSYEVLRNKMNSSEKLLRKIESDIRTVFDDKTIKLSTKSTNSDEYINLQVEIQGKSKELHLQGSGFLQIVEIFSSIEFFDGALNIILLDEPDSHIHVQLLLNLINTLKRQSEHNQIFIISHNEKFVDYSFDKGKLFFLNSEVKNESKKLVPLNDNLKLYVKKELGSIISNLDEFGSVEKLVFVEGKNDIAFWKKIFQKYMKLMNQTPPNLYFIFIDGKDKIEEKIQHFLNMSAQIKKVNKVVVIFDKDFATKEVHSKEITTVKKSIVNGDKRVLSYKGYCLESTFFTDIEILLNIIHGLTKVDKSVLKQIINENLERLKENLARVQSEEYKLMKKSFITQKKNRGLLTNLEFDQYVCDTLEMGIIYGLTKDNVNNIIKDINLLSGNDENQIHMGMIENYYLENISSINDIYQEHLNILAEIKNI